MAVLPGPQRATRAGRTLRHGVCLAACSIPRALPGTLASWRRVELRCLKASQELVVELHADLGKRQAVQRCPEGESQQDEDAGALSLAASACDCIRKVRGGGVSALHVALTYATVGQLRLSEGENSLGADAPDGDLGNPGL